MPHRFPLLAFVGCAVLGPALAAEPTPDLLRAWTEMNHASIRVTTAADGDYQQFDYDITPQHDLRVRVEDVASGHMTKGSVMLIADRGLLVKDLPLDRGEEIDAIDSPALILQLVDKLLASSGKLPREIHGRLPLDRTENTWDVSVATASAEAEYPAPWTLRGSLEAKADGAIAFDLVHAFSTEDVPIEIRYRGTWQKSAKAVAFDDALALDGWRMFTFGPITRGDGRGGTIYDFGATAVEPPPKTLRALRALLARQAMEQKTKPGPAPSP